MDDPFFEFGRKSALELVRTLFYAGLLPILYAAYRFGKMFALMHPIQGMSLQSDGFYAGSERPGWILGLIAGGTALIVAVIVWKAVCEMLLVALRYFERGTGGGNDRRKRAQTNGRRKRF